MSTEPQTRILTPQEENRVPIDYFEATYSFNDKRINAKWQEHQVHSSNGDFPWYFTNTGKSVSVDDYTRVYPHLRELQDFQYHSLTGQYQGKDVCWDFNNRRWIYRNNKPVQFIAETPQEPPEETQEEEPEEPEEEEPPQDAPRTPSTPRSSEEEEASQESGDQAEVSQLLESATQAVTALITQVSRPQTPQTVPGGLPVTPAQLLPQSSLPTPRLTLHPLPQTVPPVRVITPPPRKKPSTTVPPKSTTTVMSGSGSGSGSSATKLLGSPPEPFDGKPEKAEAFWNNLENYYYLNDGAYTHESKKVSSALTHFKVGSSAGEWAQDQQKKALAQTPVTFGTWATFKDAFKKHFIPEYSTLEAANAMHSSKMGGRPFQEWYQDWSTYASRSGANEETKMFAFRKALPIALHQKIMGVSPQPTTLDGLAEKAREFDRLWRMYSNPAFTRNSGPRNRAMITEDDHVQANATTASRPLMGGKISKEEKDRRFKEKLCFYCGKPNHTARECQVKKSQLAQGTSNSRPNQRNQRPRQDFRARATVTQEETYEEEQQAEEHPAQIAAIYQVPSPGPMIPRPHSAPVYEDF